MTPCNPHLPPLLLESSNPEAVSLLLGVGLVLSWLICGGSKGRWTLSSVPSILYKCQRWAVWSYGLEKNPRTIIILGLIQNLFCFFFLFFFQVHETKLLMCNRKSMVPRGWTKQKCHHTSGLGAEDIKNTLKKEKKKALKLKLFSKQASTYCLWSSNNP